MGLTISLSVVRERLDEAFLWAVSDRPVPETWTRFARQTFQMQSKTYTPALGTVLLARATDDRIDPLSIKTEYSSNTYSLRTLGHGVLVPAARELGFSIRNTGREPLNNQPFFRYDHMSLIERVRDKIGHAQFVSEVSQLEQLDHSQALAALAAFLRVAVSVAKQLDEYRVSPGALTASRVIRTVTTFLAEDVDRPKRCQALVAAAFDVTHQDVRSRKLNDPSRDYPGDVQAFEEGKPILAAEVRAKRVRSTEVEGFVEACRQAGIDRAFVIALWPPGQSLSVQSLQQKASESFDVILTIIEHGEELIYEVFSWSDTALPMAIGLFTTAVLSRLKEIEATDQSLARWTSLLRRLQDGDDVTAQSLS